MPTPENPKTGRGASETGVPTETVGTRIGVRPRFDALDWVRGLVMVLMALDHSRDFVGDPTQYATDPAKADPAIYCTRWVTHVCAPTFLFLTGVGAWLGRGRGKTTASLSLYLFTRGLWMLVLEATAIKFVWEVYHPKYDHIGFNVFGALGGGMLLLSALVWLPRLVSLAFGLAVVFGHALLYPIVPADFGEWGWVWRILHDGGGIKVTETFGVWFAYPWLPWAGVMALGYGVGDVFTWDRERRRPALILAGAVLLATFAGFRVTNLYGDPKPWQLFDDPIRTAMAVLNCEKYPPSCAYLWATLGVMALVTAAADRPAGPPGRWITTFGRVPLFFYLLHLPVIHAFMIAVYAHGRYMGWFPPPEEVAKTGMRNSLGVVYVAWFWAVFALYWPCKWFAGVKARSRNVLLSYL